jgi:hypothetical protein
LNAPEWENDGWVDKWYRIICEKVRDEQLQELMKPINLTLIELDINEESGD